MAADLQNFIFFDPYVGEFKFGKDSDLRVLPNGMFPKNSAQVLASQYMKREQMSFREMERRSSH